MNNQRIELEKKYFDTFEEAYGYRPSISLAHFGDNYLKKEIESNIRYKESKKNAGF